ncbi:arginine--tRNA ligase [Aerococcus sanguinicola]|uniref:arginine--tRNA ligase n=1 Tax=Aerococcus sanguinicola TaxID=119206 RepID=UPI0018A7742D|nr:arginine--tRNA ligase [Aerococcus sanguinicola]
MDEKQKIVDLLYPIVGEHLNKDEIMGLIEVPANQEFGDLAFPTFQLTKTYRQAPQKIAEEITEKLGNPEGFSEITAIGPYINFKSNREFVTKHVISNVLEQGSDYGKTDIGKQGNITIDMSSPNIAKPMSMGHLRSTVIGNALSFILEKLNYNVIRINHLGDWGTQFGKLIVAYRKWGDEETVRKDPVNELVKLYVEFHERAEEDPALDEEGRAAFKALEDGDEDVVALWNWFKDESIKAFQKVYDLLNVHFDYYTGESFYNDKMQPIIDELEDKGISEVEQGAVIVRLDEEDLPPALIQKSDGATLYLTRDLATAYYRKATFDFVESLYIVGNEQTNHFNQLKAVLKRLGRDWADNMHHIPFGLITLNGKKLSTRKGKIVLLEDVLNEATKLAYEQIETKNPDLPNKDEVAAQVGPGAVIFHDLKNERLHNFDFNLQEVVQFEGETGPYVQYAHARIQTILEKYGKEVEANVNNVVTDDYSWQIVKLLEQYPKVVIRAAKQYEPSVVSKYLISLAQAFNKYYGNTRILEDDEQLEARIALISAVAIVLKDGLSLLGIAAPNKM